MPFQTEIFRDATHDLLPELFEVKADHWGDVERDELRSERQVDDVAGKLFR
jgi:hypothetical protein